jgi:MATE family multidrug resistance protein
MSIALIFIGVYHFAGTPLLKVMTSDAVVIGAAGEYMPWLLLMPVVGCAAFTWDGIFIGATASRQMRDSMLWAVVAFAAVYAVGILGVNGFIHETSGASTVYQRAAMHVLMAAYFAHLLARTLYLTVNWRKSWERHCWNREI